MALVDEAFAVADHTGQHLWDAELWRLRGQLLAQTDADETLVENCYCRAMQIAQQQRARSLELRAALALSHHWHAQGRHDEAHALLTEVYDWFTEGFDTRDLRAARAMLEQLEQGPL